MDSDVSTGLNNPPDLGAYMQSVLDSSNHSIWGIDTGMRLVFMNRYGIDFFQKLTGTNITIGSPFAECVPADWQAAWINHYKQAFQRETFTIFHTLKDNKGDIYLEISFKPVILNKEVTGVTCQAIDITEQRLQELSLQESEEKFKKVFDNAHIAISIQTQKKILLVNREWERITGYTASDAQMMSPLDLLHPNQRLRISQLDFERLSGRDEPENYEIQLYTKNKEERWVDVHASQINFEGQKAVLLAGNDITLKKEADKLIQKLSTAVTNSPTSIVITDKNASIEYVNPHFSSFTGYSFDEAVGQDPRILKSGNTPTEVYKDMWKTLLSKQVWVGEFENRKKNGEVYWESARIAPLIDNKGEITHFIAVKEDITSLKLTQQRLELSQKELLDLNAKKDKFFSIIAHDLRSPFTGLLNLTQLLHENFDALKPEKTKNFLRMLNDSAINVFQLLENLLEWSKTQTGRVEFQPITIKLADLVNESISLVALNAQNKEITINNHVGNDIFVMADKNMLQTIIRNLLGNAIKYTPKSGSVFIGACESTNNQKFVNVSIKDTGVGIPIEKQSKIFKIGENYSTPGTELEKGTGLGLIICKEFVEKHGGRIWCESIENVGTTFTFSIPVAK